MNNLTTKTGGFGSCLTIAFESRRSAEIAALISNYGGVPLVAPAVREAMLGDNPAAFAFAEELFAGKLDAVIFMTGVGTSRLIELLQRRYPLERVIQGLAETTVVARGPKPTKVLRDLKVPITVTVPDPYTWREMLQEFDENPRGFSFQGSRVAVQEYGVLNERFVQGLKERGAEVLRVQIYEWKLPEDTGPLKTAIDAILEGRARIVLFTTSAQVYHLFQFASEIGCKQQLLEALAGCVICSVGPTCTETLHGHRIQVDLEPERPKMGALVYEAAQRAQELLRKKINDSAQARGPEGREAAINSQESEAGKRSTGRTSNPQAAGAGVRKSPGAAPWDDSRFMKACRREPVDATPVWLMRQAGRYMKEYREIRARVPFLELCKSPDLVSEVTVTAAKMLGVDAAIIFADLLLIVEPLGFGLAYDKGEGPVITPPLRSPADVDRLQEVDPQQSLAYFYHAIRQTRSDLDLKLPLLGFAGCPFTLASYLIEGGGSRGYRHTKSLMYQDPGVWRALMEHLARNLAKYINGQITAGVQAVQIFDTWVGCLGPADYREFALPYTRMMIERITPGTPIIHFGTGTGMFLEDMRGAGGGIIGLDSHVELDEAWARLGYSVGVQGNLDPVVLCAGQPYIRSRVQRILNQAGGRPGHIFNLGHGLLPDTPYQNVVALVDMVHELSGKR